MNRFQFLDAWLHWFGSCGLIDIRLEEHVRGKKPNKNLFIPLRLEIKRTEKRKSQKLVLLFEAISQRTSFGITTFHLASLVQCLHYYSSEADDQAFSTSIFAVLWKYKPWHPVRHASPLPLSPSLPHFFVFSPHPFSFLSLSSPFLSSIHSFTLFCFLFLLPLSSILGNEQRTLHILGNHHKMEIHAQALVRFLQDSCIYLHSFLRIIFI